MADNNKKTTIIEIRDPLTNKELEEAINKRLDFHQNIISAVLLVVGVGFITVIIAVFAIFIDHKNYAAQKYNEYIKLIKTQQEQLGFKDLDVEQINKKQDSKRRRIKVNK